MRTILTAIVALFLSGPAAASPVELRGLVDAERPAGCNDYSFLFWDFYRAELWSDSAVPPGETFGLSLTYRSSFSRAELVDTSIEEMARISGRADSRLAEVRRTLLDSFRDVEPGDRISTWRVSEDELRLFVNGVETGVLTRDVDLFLDIWLGPKSRDQDGRAALLAGRCDD